MSSTLRVGPRLKELRIHLCQKSGASDGTRKFIEEHYVKIKRNNPDLPILVRECSGVHPTLWARYEFGREVSVPVSNSTSSEILKVVGDLFSR